MAKAKVAKRLNILRSEIDIDVECFPEEMAIEGNASAVDEDTDRETVDWIRKQLARGNEWAWCAIKVTASWKGFKGEDRLGGCSYKSEQDFVKCGDYYQDMVNEAIDDLVSEIETACKCDVVVKVVE